MSSFLFVHFSEVLISLEIRKRIYIGAKNTLGCLCGQSNKECWKYEWENPTVLEFMHFFPLSRI